MSVRGNAAHLLADVEVGIAGPSPCGDRGAYGAATPHSSAVRRCRDSPLRACYGFASGAANTSLQAAGSCASVIGGFGFGGSFGGFGCSTESLNQ